MLVPRTIWSTRVRWQESQEEQDFTIPPERQGFFQGISKEWGSQPVRNQEHGRSQE